MGNPQSDGDELKCPKCGAVMIRTTVVANPKVLHYACTCRHHVFVDTAPFVAESAPAKRTLLD